MTYFVVPPDPAAPLCSDLRLGFLFGQGYFSVCICVCVCVLHHLTHEVGCFPGLYPLYFCVSISARTSAFTRHLSRFATNLLYNACMCSQQKATTKHLCVVRYNGLSGYRCLSSHCIQGCRQWSAIFRAYHFSTFASIINIALYQFVHCNSALYKFSMIL